MGNDGEWYVTKDEKNNFFFSTKDGENILKHILSKQHFLVL